MPDTMRTSSSGRPPGPAVGDRTERAHARARRPAMGGVWADRSDRPDPKDASGAPGQGPHDRDPDPGRTPERPVRQPESETEPDVEGELIYHGPNVMLGYATQPEDLRAGTPSAESCTRETSAGSTRTAFPGHRPDQANRQGLRHSSELGRDRIRRQRLWPGSGSGRWRSHRPLARGRRRYRARRSAASGCSPVRAESTCIRGEGDRGVTADGLRQAGLRAAG